VTVTTASGVVPMSEDSTLTVLLLSLLGPPVLLFGLAIDHGPTVIVGVVFLLGLWISLTGGADE
jgi:hypothetical protein